MTTLIRTTALFFLFIVSLSVTAQDLTAPSWQLNDSDGNAVNSADFAGKPLVIHFWATWCPYCKKLQPGLDALESKYAQDGLQVIAISFREDPGTQPQAVLVERGLNLKTLIDGDEVAQQLFGVKGTPTTFFIDHTGKVLGVTRTSDPSDPVLDQAAQRLISLYEAQ